MTKTNIQRLHLPFLILLILLAACAPQTPIAVYVTPTPQPIELVATSTLQPTPEVTTDSATDTSAETRLGFTLTSIQAESPRADIPTVTWQGPVIGPGYQLPPTSTLPPTTVPPTVEGQPSVTPAVEATQPYPDVLPDLDPSRIGVQIDSNLEQKDWDEAMRRVGSDQLAIKWIKLQIPWRDLQPNSPDEMSQYFQRLQLYIQDADRRQVNILLSVAKAPLWARSNQDQDGPPDDPQALAHFMTMLLNEVGGSIDAVEVWNEPNLIREWTGTLPFSGAGYMQLFDAAYQAIRAYSPTMPIVTAGLAPTGENPGTVDDRTFLQQMYAAGLGNYKDIAIGIHPYSWANSPDATCCGTEGWDDDPHFFFADTIRDYRQMMESNGQADLQLWVTEFGWATWDGFPGSPPQDSEWMLKNSIWDQANYTIRAFQIGQQTPYIGPMILWNLNFATLEGLVSNRDERIAYSIVIPGKDGVLNPDSTDTTERPLYWMIYDAVRPDVNLDTYN